MKDIIISNKTIHCANCNQDKPIFSFDKSYIVSSRKYCRVCRWELFKQDVIQKYMSKGSEEYKIVTYILDNNINSVNYIAECFNKSIKEVASLIIKSKIRINGMCVNTVCDHCGADISITPSKYLSCKEHFCSDECYYTGITIDKPRGENSIFYNRVTTTCTNCGKEIRITPYDYNKKNRFGDSHHFCSQQCYWEFRGSYYHGDKHAGFEMTDQIRDKMKKSLAQRMVNDNRLDTQAQLKANDILDLLGIKYKREHPLEYYSIDNYLIDYNLMIEVQGDYWHCNPIKYNEIKYGINNKQAEQIHRDKIKSSYILNHVGVHILYLWETDLIKHPDVCRILIQEYINKRGVLQNYNSFNYHIEDETLLLNNILIKSYQEMNVDNYRHIIKNPA